MENTKKQNWFMNFIKAFTTSEGSDDGRVSEEKLSQEEKALLAEIRNMDKVENIEKNIRSRIAAKVDFDKAREKAKSKAKANEEKTIGIKE